MPQGNQPPEKPEWDKDFEGRLPINNGEMPPSTTSSTEFSIKGNENYFSAITTVTV
jgi:hypothetical protein